MLQALKILDRLDGSKLLTDYEEMALAIVSNAIVAITTDPSEWDSYPDKGIDFHRRLRLRIKVWHEDS